MSKLSTPSCPRSHPPSRRTPLYLFLMPVWLFLASAVAGIRPPAEDRSTPFKWWSAGETVVTSRALPDYERDSDCCDGGLGRGGRCRIPPALMGVWRHARVVVVSAGLPHQMDGCDASPELHVLRLPGGT